MYIQLYFYCLPLYHIFGSCSTKTGIIEVSTHSVSAKLFSVNNCFGNWVADTGIFSVKSLGANPVDEEVNQCHQKKTKCLALREDFCHHLFCNVLPWKCELSLHGANLITFPPASRS